MMMQGAAVATMGLLLGCADAAIAPPKHVIFFPVRHGGCGSLCFLRSPSLARPPSGGWHGRGRHRPPRCPQADSSFKTSTYPDEYLSMRPTTGSNAPIKTDDVADLDANDQQDTLTLQLLPAATTTPGGRCLDGTMAGYFIHKGTDPELFVVYLKGGGACYDEDSCTKRAKSALGSSVRQDVHTFSAALGLRVANLEKHRRLRATGARPCRALARSRPAA